MYTHIHIYTFAYMYTYTCIMAYMEHLRDVPCHVLARKFFRIFTILCSQQDQAKNK